VATGGPDQTEISHALGPDQLGAIPSDEEAATKGWGISGGVLGALSLLCCFCCYRSYAKKRANNPNERRFFMSGLVPALETGGRPWRPADLKYKLVGIWSQVRELQEEVWTHNLLTREGRLQFSSRMRARQLAREKEEDEDLQEML